MLHCVKTFLGNERNIYSNITVKSTFRFEFGWWKSYTLNHPNLNIPFNPWCWWSWNHQHQRLLIPPTSLWSLPCYLWSSPLHLWTTQLAPTVVANYSSSRNKTFLHQRSLQIFQQTQLIEHIISCCKLSLGSSTVINPQLDTDLISAHGRSDLCPG